MRSRGTQKKWPIYAAGVAVLLAALAFAGAFYFMDGMSVARDLLVQLTSVRQNATPAPGPANAADALDLPGRMPNAFALGVWEEQIDSQSIIKQMIDGEVASLSVERVKIDGNKATVYARVMFANGASAPGTIGLRKYGGVWYIGYISSRTTDDVAGGEKRDVAELKDVDGQLLQTIIAEQAKGSAVTEGLVSGEIGEIGFGAAQPGSNTAVIPLELMFGAEKRYADLVAIRTQVDGDDMWFIARFNETGSDTDD
jgi:hypothetical protein